MSRRRSIAFIVWMVLVGSLVHELYPWTGEIGVVGLLAPIDESVWEHFKLGYTAALLWLVGERIARTSPPSSLLGAGVGVIILNIIVIAVFFIIRPLLPDEASLAVDIGSYVVGCFAMGGIVSRFSRNTTRMGEVFGLILLVAIGFTFVAATIWKPDLPLFIEGGLG